MQGSLGSGFARFGVRGSMDDENNVEGGRRRVTAPGSTNFLPRPAALDRRSKAADAREKGKVFVNDAEVAPRDVRVRLKVGDEVRVWQDRPGSSKRQSFPFKAGDLNILYEDEYLIVLNKPAGLLTVPLERQEDEPSIAEYLERHLRSHGKRKPFVVHRIDRDTSGVVLFAKDSATQFALKAQFRERTPERVYLAVVYGHPEAGIGHVAQPPGMGQEGADPERNVVRATPSRGGHQRRTR